ncbi:amidase [Algicella marina]|uniref:Amidase n=1 Tax=Algicella marina TaxID=2683284 RepID=A0A6P1T5V4_9RHOB|nr:amidase [Algicella marina]QHQ37191.1 amidase [Algicella marina]
MSRPHALTASDAAEAIRSGRLTATKLVSDCLARIEETDGTLHAWAHVDAEGAMAAAEEADSRKMHGLPLGPLHGVPVGLKDIIDTAGQPTTRGTPIFAGRQPVADARIVTTLREAGAIILGKTVTTELAFVHAAETRNPHNPAHTPGGSSSGSAAAVGAFQVPLAVGTQTNGSVIRPASFCGTFGFKPTRGLIPRTGVLQTSVSLDQLGTFARSVEDIALVTEALMSADPADPKSLPHHKPHLAAGAAAEPPVEPALAVFDLPYSSQLASDTTHGLAELSDALGARVEHHASPPAFASLPQVQSTIHLYEITHHLADVFDENWDAISDSLRPLVETGRKITADQHAEALERMGEAERWAEAFFKDFDAILAPSALGEAPLFGPATGDPICCTYWTVMGLPCLSLPLLTGDAGLPIGVQLIGRQQHDDRLLRTANWLLKTLTSPEA